MLVLFNIFEQTWFQGILIAFGAGVAALITWAFATFQTWLSTKIKNEKVRAISDTVLTLVRDSVIYVNQTFVDQLKKDGKFDKENQKEAFSKALERVKINLTEESRKLLEEVYGDVDAWLTTQVEAIIGMLH